MSIGNSSTATVTPCGNRKYLEFRYFDIHVAVGSMSAGGLLVSSSSLLPRRMTWVPCAPISLGLRSSDTWRW